MFLSSWLRKQTSMPRQRTQTHRLTLERLEDRCVPSAGFLDPTFGSNGVVTTQVGQVGKQDYAHAAAVYPAGTANAGKIVIAGGATGGNGNSGSLDFALVRYNANGSLDPTFGNGGTAITSLVSSEDQAMAVALVGDKVLAGGYALVNFRTNLDDFALARFNADGTLDQTFGTKGKVLTDFGGSDDIGMALAVQADGKIVLAGTTNGMFAVARYNPNGTLDTTFGNGGKVTVNVSQSLQSGTDRYVDLALSGNQIVLVGRARSTSDMYVVRLTATGQLDPTFGTGGVLQLGLGYDTRLAVQSDGKLVVAYNSNFDPNYGIFVTRLLTNGATDTGFGTGGTASLPWSVTGGAKSSAVAVDPLGRIVIGGGEDNNGGSGTGKLVIARFTPAGALDPTFGVGGFNTSGNALSLDTGLNAFPMLALQPDGKTLLVGTAGNQADGWKFAAARFTGDSTLLAGSLPNHAISASINASEAQPLLAEAESRWQAAGVDISVLHGIDVGIANLGGTTLGLASGNTSYFVVGGIYNAGTATVQQSTLSSNSASSAGGGIYNAASSTLAVKDSTVVDNLAPLGADIYNLGALTLDDSIVAVIGP